MLQEPGQAARGLAPKVQGARVLERLFRERDLDFLYICYDNEGYGNTGQQYSPATPHAARTSTSSGSQGYPGFKKDLFSIWAAHKPAYVATVIGTGTTLTNQDLVSNTNFISR